MPDRTLYGIGDEIEALLYHGWESYMNGDGVFDEEAYEAALERLEIDLFQKIDGVACAIKTEAAFAEALKAEKLRLEARQKAAEGKVRWLKSYLSREMRRAGITSHTSARARISHLTSRVLYIDDEAAAVRSMTADEQSMFVSTETTWRIDKVKLKEWLFENDDRKLPGVSVKTNLNIQVK